MTCVSSKLCEFIFIGGLPEEKRDKRSRLPCYVFCICLLTQQEVVTPYTARNFAIGGPTAREGQLDRFFLQKWHFIYKLSVKKQRTGQKRAKPPQKRWFFPEKGPGPFSDKLSQLIGGAGKTTFFGGFLPVFCPVLCFFTDNLYMKCHFCKKKSVQLTFSSRRTANCKVPSRITLILFVQTKGRVFWRRVFCDYTYL